MKESDETPGAAGQPGASRRRFLGWLSRGFLGLWGVGLAWVLGSYLKPPRSRRSLAERVLKAGPLDTLAPGEARLVRHGREPVYVVRADEQTLVGLSGVCTHLRCVLSWSGEERALVCPCHEGAFDLNGNVLRGPPPRSLRRYRVESQLGEIYVQL